VPCGRRPVASAADAGLTRKESGRCAQATAPRAQPPPAQLEDDPGFGPGHIYPELTRHALGHVPDELKPVRMLEGKQGSYGPFEVGHPVPAGDLPARLREGWQLAS
jgi:hypothetical protein